MREMEKTNTSLVFRIGGYEEARYYGLRNGADPANFEYKVLVEGDSWANILYPWSEYFFGYNEAFPNFIERDPRFYYRNIGWPGDTLEDIVTSSHAPDGRKGADSGLYQPIRSGIFDFLVFSGGGNDFLGGGQLECFLKPYRAGTTDPWECLDRAKVDGIYDKIRDQYLQIISLVNVSSPQTKILLHGYDHAIPKSGGRWLGVPFTSKGYTPESPLCSYIIAVLVDRMYELLGEIAASNRTVRVVDVRGLCSNHWHDELHPDRVAARAIADKFIGEMVSARYYDAHSVVNVIGEGDGDCIPALIELGSRTETIAAVHAKAAGYMEGSGFTFPTRSCAATLSAFLQMSGIDIKTERGAGALASMLKKRGWGVVDVGHQKPGDVGVTISSLPPPGPDHIYLVVETHNSDRMTIADNQAPDPHERFASGRGKTPTDYFLRAPGFRVAGFGAFDNGEELRSVDYASYPFEDEDTNDLAGAAE